MRVRNLVLLGTLATLVLAPANALADPTFEQQIVTLVNQQRWQNGQLPPLKGHVQLDASSETHASNMASRDFFAHCDLDNYTLPWDRMVAAGYVWSWAGENIAAGYGTPELVMTGWMASSGHRANILHANFTEIGVGYLQVGSDNANVRIDSNSDCNSDSNNGPFFRYWVQNFGSRSSYLPVVINREDLETQTREVDLYLYGSGWAQQMRIRNQGDAWPGWQAFASNVDWTLPAANGVKVVEVEVKNAGGTVRAASDEITLTGQILAAGDIAGIGTGVVLKAPYPNPLQGATTVGFELTEPGWVRIAVHDVAGRRLATLLEGHVDAGLHEARWTGEDEGRNHVAPGIYFIRLETKTQRMSAKIVVSS